MVSPPQLERGEEFLGSVKSSIVYSHKTCVLYVSRLQCVRAHCIHPACERVAAYSRCMWVGCSMLMPHMSGL